MGIRAETKLTDEGVGEMKSVTSADWYALTAQREMEVCVSSQKDLGEKRQFELNLALWGGGSWRC